MVIQPTDIIAASLFNITVPFKIVCGIGQNAVRRNTHFSKTKFNYQLTPRSPQWCQRRE